MRGMLTERLFKRSARPQGLSAEPQPSRWHPWWSNSYLLTPLLSILVFLVVMSLILWSLNRREQQQQENTLYRNTAWAQQQIRLSMTDVQDELQTFARDLAIEHIDQQIFQIEASNIALAHPEILSLSGYTRAGVQRWVAEPLPRSPEQHLAQPSEAQQEKAVRAMLSQASHTHRQTYSPLFYDTFGNGYLALHAPVIRERVHLGSIVAIFSVDGILKYGIPSELSAKYKISIVDIHNGELTTTSSRPRLPRDAHYELPLDPPGQGMSVRVYAYPQITNFTNNTLVWLVVGLSCFVLWSLWSLWKHTRQRFEAQQALYAEAFFRRAMENSVLIGMRVLDMHGRITHVNPAFCRMTGWDESDLMGKTAPFPYWPAGFYPEMQRQLDMTLRGKAPSAGFELRVQRKDGSLFHARLYVSPLIDSSGRQTGWMSSMTDITEPKHAREELAAAHERFTTVLESLDAAVSVLAADETELLFANRYYRHLFGIRPSGHLELSGGGIGTALTSSDSIDMVDAYAGLPATALTESTTDTQEVYVARIQKWFEVRRQYIQWVDGHLAQMQIATDITARKQTQELAHQQAEKLQFTSRLMTMGEMASSIAHELNQPLAAINNYCSGTVALVKSGRPSAESLLPVLEKTAQQAVRAGMIVKRIREFVKRSEPKRQPAHVADIIADAVGLAEIEAHKRHIRIITDIRAKMPSVHVDPVLIEQVLLNLLKNAAEAMQEARPSTTDGVILVHADLEGEFVNIRVIDQGTGVDEATVDQLFEPFYSTKSDGMGMGLNICRSIIESHRGRLWVVNNVDTNGRVIGATFHCSLPVFFSGNSEVGETMKTSASHTIMGEI